MLAALLLAMSVQATTREIDFTGVGGLKLHGTLELPAGAKSARALLLVPGSGPTDRNGNQPPALITDLLKQIADNLAQHGIASFRFDKRAAHVHSADWPKTVPEMNDFFGWDKFVGDAEAALSTLKAQPEIDKDRVGVLGHSEGGLIALQMAASSGPYALVLIGTPGRKMGDVLRMQVDQGLRAQTKDEAVIKQYNDATDRTIKQLEKDATIPADLPPGLGPLFNPTAAKLLQSYFKLDTPKLAAAYGGPVLLINGEYDNQVSAKLDTPLLAAALASRKVAIMQMLIVAQASHNLKSAKSLTDSTFEGPVSSVALEAIYKWFAGLS
jgi:pimeloyl-ACP methyl ester carboxylesterase